MPRATTKPKIPRDPAIGVQVNPDAKPILKRHSERLGMAEKLILSRLLYWFDHLSELEQGVVMRHITGERAGEVAEMVLRRVHGSADQTFEDALRSDRPAEKQKDRKGVNTAG